MTCLALLNRKVWRIRQRGLYYTHTAHLFNELALGWQRYTLLRGRHELLRWERVRHSHRVEVFAALITQIVHAAGAVSFLAIVGRLLRVDEAVLAYCFIFDTGGGFVLGGNRIGLVLVEESSVF